MRNIEFSSNLVLSQYSMVHEMRARVFPNVGRMCVLLTSASDQNAQACPSPQDARAALRSTRHHGPLSNTSLYVETKNVFIEI